MKLYLKFIKYYLNFLSSFAPNYGAKVAINLFQKIIHKKIKPKEEAFYKEAKSYTLKTKTDDIQYYELGNPNGKVVFIIHGWNSNAGSLTRFAFELATKNYRVISLDLPAHGYSKGTHTNLFICKDVLITLIKHLNINGDFSIIGHSFGAALVGYSLSELNYPINKIVLLSANNKMKEIFSDFKKLIGYNDIIDKKVCDWVNFTTGENLETLVLSDKLKQINYKDLLIIHDKFDKVIPFNNALGIKESIPSITVIPFEKIGHYRMLWNEDVIRETIHFIDK